MKFLSFNYRGVENPQKKLALKKLILLNHSSVILLQEMMYFEAYVTKMLESLLPFWKFLETDANGRSGV
jgi:hypothetical protein